MQSVQDRVRKVFDRTILGVVSELEERDELDKGNAALSAEYSQKIAQMCERDEEFSQKVYYATLFKSIGLPGVMNKVVDIKEDEARDIQRYDVFTPHIPHVQQPLPQFAKESTDYLFRLIERKDRGEDISQDKEKIVLKASLI